MSANYDASPRKRKKKSSTNSRQRGHSKIKSASQVNPPGTSSSRSLNDSNKSNNNRKRSKGSKTNKSNKTNKTNNKSNKKLSPQKQKQSHSRYATANASAVGNKNPNSPIRKKKKKARNRPKNKIKSRNKKTNAHRKAATTANALHPNRKKTSNKNNNNNSHIKSSATSPNALSPDDYNNNNNNNNGYNKRPKKRTVSNPRSFRHKFNVTEMQLVVSQIADMKKSWKTPAEDVMGKIYEIIYMEERPHLNCKHCKVMLILDDDNYRVALLGNQSEHVVARDNLKVAFETENLFLLWESQTKAPKKRSTYGQGLDNESNGYTNQPKPPPHQDIDDMYTIQQFEHTFNDTYEFRRYDFYCMAICIFIGFILSGVGVFLYLKNEQGKDLHAMGAFVTIFGPIFGIVLGIYIGCVWYCCAVGKGKMDYYLGKNRFFGFQCQACDCCKYQYFVVVSLVGMIIIGVSVCAYLLLDKFVTIDNMKSDTNNTNPANTNEKGEIDINEQKLFFAVEVIAAAAGIGLFVSGIVIYYCCTNRRVKAKKGPSIHDEEFED